MILYYTYKVDGKNLRTREDQTTEKELIDHFGDKISNITLMYFDEIKDEIGEKLCHYKVIWGFDEERVTRITELELEKAVYAMAAKITMSLGGMMLDGKLIIAIKEDFNTEMGWQPTYVIKDADWVEIRNKKLDDKYIGKLNDAKDRVRYMIDNNRIDLIGKNIPASELYKGNYKQLN